MSTSKGRKMDDYLKVDMGTIERLAKKSGFTMHQISQIVGKSPTWLFDRIKNGKSMHKDELNRLAPLLGFDIEDVLIKEPEPKPEPKQQPEQVGPFKAEKVLNLGDVSKQLEQLNKTCEAILEALKRAIDGPEPIPISKSERATEILRKALVGTSGGGVKEKDFEKMLVQAGIGSSYKTEAMRNLDCRRFVATNGITYIMKAAKEDAK